MTEPALKRDEPGPHRARSAPPGPLPRRTPSPADRRDGAIADLRDEIAQGFGYAAVEGKDTATAFAACVKPLVQALGRDPGARALIEAHPADGVIEGLPALRGVLARLGIAAVLETRRPGHLGETEYPAVALLSPGRPVVLIERIEPGLALAFDPERGDFDALDLPAEEIALCRPLAPGEIAAHPSPGALRPYWPAIARAGALSLAAALIAVTYPLLVMVLYNFAVALKDAAVILPVMLAATLLLLLEIRLRLLKSATLARIQAAQQAEIDAAVQRKFLALAPDTVAAAPRAQQIAKIEELTDRQSAATASALGHGLEVPFVLTLIVALALIHPAFALGPLIACGAGAAGHVLIARLFGQGPAAGTRPAQAEWRRLLHETVRRADAIRAEQAEAIWQARCTAASRLAATESAREQLRQGVLASLAGGLTMATGLGALWLGAGLVMEGALSVGGLIATAMLTWKAMAPLQQLLLDAETLAASPRLRRQLARFLSMAEDEPRGSLPPLAPLSGQIAFQRTLLRAERGGAQALSTIDAEIPPGSVVGLTAQTGGAPGRALELLLRLASPVSGLVLLDGVNLQQIAKRELRTRVGYCPPEPAIFPTSLIENVRLACPEASTRAVLGAMAEAGIDLSDPAVGPLLRRPASSAEIAAMAPDLAQRISLARLWLRPASLFLLDDPTARLDDDGRARLGAAIARRAGSATLLVATRDAALLERCDRVIAL